MSSTTSRRSGLRLGDPSTYVDGVPHEAIDALRAETPVAWQELGDQRGFWAVLTHADLVTVARRSDVFSAEAGGIVLEDLAPDILEMMRGMLPAMDPPRHQKFRRPLADSFQDLGPGEARTADSRHCSGVAGRCRRGGRRGTRP